MATSTVELQPIDHDVLSELHPGFMRTFTFAGIEVASITQAVILSMIDVSQPAGMKAFNDARYNWIEYATSGETALDCPIKSPGAGTGIDAQQAMARIALSANLAKFSQHPDLMDELLSTCGKKLVLLTDCHDNFWGTCICLQCRISEPATKNIMGKVLDLTRDCIMEKAFDALENLSET